MENSNQKNDVLAIKGFEINADSLAYIPHIRKTALELSTEIQKKCDVNDLHCLDEEIKKMQLICDQLQKLRIEIIL